MDGRGFALVVMTFDDESEARGVASELRNLERAGRLSIDDTAVIRRGDDGRVNVGNQIDSSVKGGAMIGGFLGLLIGSILFPLGGLVIGAAGGAAVGKLLDTGIDKALYEK